MSLLSSAVVLVTPDGNNTVINGTDLPTCNPDSQPALPPNFAALDVKITPGSSKDVDSYLCTRGVTGAHFWYKRIL